MLRILVEGWTKYPHSYCIVNVYQLVALLKIPDAKIYLREVDPYRAEWPAYKSLAGLMVTDEEWTALEAIEKYTDGTEIDVIYRISFPHDMKPSPEHKPVAVFYTAEFRKLDQVNFVAASGNFAHFCELVKKGKIAAITPSNWSLCAFGDTVVKAKSKYGNFIKVIPHGVDVSKYFPDADGRKKFRTALNIAPTDIVFLNVGAMTGNKNIVSIIKAFYEISRHHENVRLLFKGINSLYQCERSIYQSLELLAKSKEIDAKIFQECVGNKITYLDGAMGYHSIRELYNAADCYVCPYIAEGFNMPALEAQACGIPVIAPRGGPTDDFLHDECTMWLPSEEIINPSNGYHMLQTTPADLERAMLQIVTNGAEITNKASSMGPAHVEANYSWDVVARKLVKYLRSLV